MGPENNPLQRPTTVLEDSWITSLHSLGAAVCPLFIGPLANKYGRKNTMIIFSLPMLASNIILIFANTVSLFYIARFLIGVGTGCVFSVVPLYVAEISSVENRGFTSLFMSVTISFQQLVVYIIGPYVTIRNLAIISLIPSGLFLLTFGLFVPDSPYYFILVNKKENAINSLTRLRQISKSYAEKEILDVINSVEQSKTKKSPREMFRSKIVLKCFLISSGLMFFQQFTGILAIIPYLQTIFDATNTSIPGEISVMIVGLVQLNTTALTSKIIDIIDRKKLLIASNMGVFLSLVSLGAYFFLLSNGSNVSKLNWLPISSILGYIICFNLGIGPIVWTIAGEIFPSDLKTYLNGLATFTNIMCGFTISMLFPNVSLFLGMAWSVWIFAICTALSIIFIALFVPETRGKTFLDIQVMLREGKIK
ncbi:facilitated trehalose transporter Tret1-like [Anoplophora glabripennis]|uniref:facilitated trehalose transporter Tret1-like n=1 Tax=Anoplophora glabripennis TaxID=217634 RepID=UPI0008736515|nr:facilitated trehalose transporter Tret1-like [Anoplophora glabripennis]XP_018571575.1 facilitated trehalose transporter Tret1-like [Anoplophora glabripennis]XP_018571576.1 facilitated trehalose transporter Tret1-like [Anoplophora glabripennis]XP_018571577.1 facilitated trehalose transporter Tret1-like [Anoplophora glabripennis]